MKGIGENMETAEIEISRLICHKTASCVVVRRQFLLPVTHFIDSISGFRSSIGCTNLLMVVVPTTESGEELCLRGVCLIVFTRAIRY